MRTTLTIDTDVLSAARDLASKQHRTIGEVISGLARKGLTLPAPDDGHPETADFFGFSPLPRRGAIITNELVNSIRDEEGI
jgi:hypothetical protein